MTGTERGREKRRADETGGRREGLNSGPLLLRWAGQASGARRQHPGWKSGGHTHEEPSGERKQGENESENGEGRGRRLGRRAGRRDTIYLAVKPLQPSHSPLSLFLPLTFYN
ncbi:T-cell surface glycoprotein CD8 alpha chain [Sarotherodon galilaeus]